MSKVLKKDIDVIIPVYNGEDFILDAINSVVNQSYKPNKIIIINDGSKDNTLLLINKYAETSKIDIKIITKENNGLSSARNTGIKESNAYFIAFLDADDLWEENKLEEQLKIFESSDEFSNLGLIYCRYSLIDINGNKYNKKYIVPLDKKMRGYVFNEVLKANKILSSGSGVLIKRTVFDTVGNFDETLKFGEDWDMWIRISEKFEIDYVDKILVNIRRHKSNMSHDLFNVFLGEIGFYNKWIPKLKGRSPVPMEWSDRIMFRILKLFPKTGLIKELKLRMSKDSYDELFTKKFLSIYLYFFIFLIRGIKKIIISPIELLRFLKK